MASILGKQWGLTFIANGTILASGLAGGVIAARLLGVEDRGVLAAILYWPHFVAGIAAMGLNEAIAIRTAQSGASGTLRATTLALSLALAIPVVAVGVLLMPMLLGSSRSNYLVFTQIYFAAFVPLTFIAMNFLAIDQGEFKIHRYNVQRTIQASTYPLLLVVFWLAGYLTAENAAVAVLAGTGLVAMVRLWDAKTGLSTKPVVKEALEILIHGVRLHAANLVMFFSMQIDKMALVLFSNDMQVGLYVVAVTVAGAAQSLFVQTYINIMMPAAAKSGLNIDTIEIVISPLRKLLLIIIISTILMIFAVPMLLPFVFGDQYVAAIQYTQILTGAFAFMGLKNALVYIYRAWGINRPSILCEGFTAFVLVTGAYPVLQSWGVLGLAYLMFLAHLLGASLLLYFFLKTTGVRMHRLVGYAARNQSIWNDSK